MNHSISCGIVASLFVAVSLSAQSPLPPETMNKASYAMGASVGRQVQASNNGMNKDLFFKGFAEGATQDIADGMSYVEGMRMALRMRQEPVGFNPQEVLKGMQDVVGGKELAYPEEELKAAVEQLQEIAAAQQQEQQKQQQAMMEEAQKMGAANKEVGEAFLKENAAKKGVTTTITGLQYEVLKAAEGAKPAATATVKVHYTGRLLNGTVFDSSVERGEPVEFPLNGVIPGWTEGVQLMSVGSKYRFWIPSALAYGENAPRSIGPNQVLDFEVELLEIVKP